MKKKVVLAYSGGLDTSFCIKYLTEEKQLLVDAVYVNVGGANEEELKDLKDRAIKLGAGKFEVIDKVNDFYKDCIKFLVFGNVLRNDTYPLSVSAERMVQAISIAEYANNSNADYIAHGSTGAGNDQVRFDVVFGILNPDKEIITPIRDLQLSRQEEIEYLEKHGVSIKWSKAKYSINKGLWGTSIGGAETLTSHLSLPQEAYPSQLKEKESKEIVLGFKNGEINSLNHEEFNPIEIINKLNEIGNNYAVGRDIHVGDTIVGIKGRVAFESAAALLIIKSHKALEKHVLTKWQMHWKDQLANWYGMFLHEAQFLDPVMRNIENFLEDSQKNVTGKVIVKLHPYRFEIQGVTSRYDLMSSEFGSYGEQNKGFTGADVRGFTKVYSNANRIFNAVQNKIGK